MRTRFLLVAVAGLAVGAYVQPCLAQNAGGGSSQVGVGGTTVPLGSQMGHGTMTQEQFNQLQDYADLAHRLTKEDKAKGRTLDDLLAQDKVDAAALVATMPFSCNVASAILAAEGPETMDGKAVDTKTYEVACADGMGYFLVSQTPGSPYGISCFAADAAHAADVAAGRKPGTVCALPANTNINAMATQMMTRAGTPCAVMNHQWHGQSSATSTEFDEVKCGDDAGYMLAVALPGSKAGVRVSTCHEAAMQGLPCKLSDNGAAVISLQVFKDALGQHKIVCDAGAQDMHVFGQETVQKRYVVEFRCPQRPAGLVAFIPVEGNRAPFEAIDCATAARRRVMCTLTPAH